MSFDSFAAAYDEGFGLSPTGRLFRFRVAERVMSGTPGGGSILDIGCGTGEDALWLAAQGYAVRGIDASPKMIEAARAKARASNSPATFECRPLEDLSPDAGRFDAVISNFGALNCVPTATWARAVPALLTSTGRAFVVLMGRRPLPESLRRGSSAADRGSTVDVAVGATSVTVHYESVAAVRRALASTATIRRVEALGCFVPGPGYVGFAQRHPILIGLLAASESVVRAIPIMRSRGDHILFEFEAR